MKRLIPLIVAALFLSPRPASGAQDKASKLPRGQFTLTWEGGRVTVHANEASTESILRDFSQKSGIGFNKFTGKTGQVTLNLEGAAVEELLDRLIGSYVTQSKRVNGGIRICSVTIMDEGAEGAPPPPPPPPEEARDQPEKPPEEISPEEDKALSPRERRRRRRPFRRRRPGQEAVPQPETPAEQPPEPPPPKPEQPEP